MKRVISLVIFVVLLVSLFGCTGNNQINIELTAKEGEPANGFLWENNFNEITITGYEGADVNIVIPSKINGKSVTKVAAGAFVGFTGMKSLTVPGCVKTIEDAFGNCTSLEVVKLSEGLENIDYAFKNCTSMQSIQIPSSVKSMKGTFADCTALKTVNIPEGITELDDTFENCASIESLVLPESYTRAFYEDGMTGLQKLTMSEGALEASLDVKHTWMCHIETDTKLEAYQKLFSHKSDWIAQAACGTDSMWIEGEYYGIIEFGTESQPEILNDGIHNVVGGRKQDGLYTYLDIYLAANNDETPWTVIHQENVLETVYAWDSWDNTPIDKIEVNGQVYTVASKSEVQQDHEGCLISHERMDWWLQ